MLIRLRKASLDTNHHYKRFNAMGLLIIIPLFADIPQAQLLQNQVWQELLQLLAPCMCKSQYAGPARTLDMQLTQVGHPLRCQLRLCKHIARWHKASS